MTDSELSLGVLLPDKSTFICKMLDLEHRVTIPTLRSNRKPLGNQGQVSHLSVSQVPDPRDEAQKCWSLFFVTVQYDIRPQRRDRCHVYSGKPAICHFLLQFYVPRFSASSSASSPLLLLTWLSRNPSLLPAPPSPSPPPRPSPSPPSAALHALDGRGEAKESQEALATNFQLIGLRACKPLWGSGPPT